jgi:hypothetical protein
MGLTDRKETANMSKIRGRRHPLPSSNEKERSATPELRKAAWRLLQPAGRGCRVQGSRVSSREPKQAFNGIELGQGGRVSSARAPIAGETRSALRCRIGSTTFWEGGAGLRARPVPPSAGGQRRSGCARNRSLHGGGVGRAPQGLWHLRGVWGFQDGNRTAGVGPA